MQRLPREWCVCVCVCVIRKCENFNVVKYFRSFIRRVKQVQRLIAEPTDTAKKEVKFELRFKYIENLYKYDGMCVIYGSVDSIYY